MLVINRVIALLITLAMTAVAPVMIAYSGFLYVVNPVNAAGKSKARDILWNTVRGIVIALAAWLIINALMAVLYHPSNWTATWYSIVTSSGDPCLSQKGANPTDTLEQSEIPAINTGVGGGKNVAMCPATNTACSPSALMSIAGFSQTQANVMSCIAATESSGDPSKCKGNACGLFQIMLTVNPLNGAACAQYNGGKEIIDCKKICSGNDGIAITTPSCQPCVNGAKNATCNAQSAYNMMQAYGYKPWTTKALGGWSDNAAADACVQRYSYSP